MSCPSQPTAWLNNGARTQFIQKNIAAGTKISLAGSACSYAAIKRMYAVLKIPYAASKIRYAVLNSSSDASKIAYAVLNSTSDGLKTIVFLPKRPLLPILSAFLVLRNILRTLLGFPGNKLTFHLGKRSKRKVLRSPGSAQINN